MDQEEYDSAYSAQMLPCFFCIELEAQEVDTALGVCAWINMFPLGYWEKLLSQGPSITSHNLSRLFFSMYAPPPFAVCVFVCVCVRVHQLI